MNRRDFLKRSLILGSAAIIAPYSLNWRPQKALAQTAIPLPAKTIWWARLNSGMPDMYALYGWMNVPQYSRVKVTGYAGSWPVDTDEPSGTWHDGFATLVTTDYSNGLLPHKFVHLDIESWPSSNQAERLATATKFRNFTTQFKNRMPGWKIGYYAFPIDLSTAYNSYMAGPGDSTYETWAATLDDYIEMYEDLDGLFPSFYIPYSRSSGGGAVSGNNNVRYITRMIIEARRMARLYAPGIRIYPYVWERRHVDNELIDLDIYETVCRLSFQLGDGCVIWGGFFPHPYGAGPPSQQTWAAESADTAQGGWWNRVWLGMATSGRYWGHRINRIPVL